MLSDPSFSSKVKYKSNQTIIKLSIDHAAMNIPAGYMYKMMYKLEGSTKINDSTYNFTANDSLVVAYNPDSLTAYEDVQLKIYSNLYNAKLTILDVYDISGASPVLVPVTTLQQRNFFIELAMQYQPYLKTHYLPSDMGLTASSTYDATKQVLNVKWSPVTNPYLGKVTPTQYELEWTYADNYAQDGTELAASAVRYTFKNNATRVSTDSSNYSIPVVYPKGYIIYRVRMVRPDSAVYRYPIYGLWSLSTVNGMVNNLSPASYYKVTGAHMGDSLNWNYAISFAEGGKYKHVLSYFDGMLKNRQTITRFNSNPRQILVTENIYDYEGRPAITTLPSVVNTYDYKFIPGVSISSVTNVPYAASDFDKKPTACPDEVTIPPFTNNSFANAYYSTLNTDTAGMQKFVPRAEGFPFVHTQLSPGFSDRIDRQGGAGDSLQISKGHDTRNEYTGADQSELNRLFGLNAGFSNFYMKTVSKDPNGQLSMSLKDFRGKPVLSAMVGASVDTSRHAIMFNDEVPNDSKFKEDKLANATQLVVGHEKKYNNTFFMDAAALINVQYEYKFKPYQVCASPYLGLSVKGSYDYSVTDQCGIIKLHHNGVLGTTGVTTNSTPAPASITDNVSLDKGKYTLDKTLSISTDEIYAAVDSFFAHKPNCAKTEEQFIKEEVENTPFPCDTLDDPCGLLAKQMMEELFPGAKYGKYTKPGGIVTGVSPSVFDYKTGHFTGYRYQSDCVLSDLNALVVHKYGQTYTNIGNLPVDTFLFLYTGADRYKIAEALLPLHPEYCRLKGCFVDTFERRLKAIPDAATAVKYGLFSLNDLVAKDTLLRSKLLAAPINMTYIADSLKLLFGGTVRMDTFASEFAFCNNDDAMAYGDAKKYFHNDIIGLNFPDTKIRNSYFDKLRAFYLFNRDKYKSIAQTGGGNACEPCDSVRMSLVPPPLVPIVYNNNGTWATGPGSLLSLFSSSTQTVIASLLNNGNTTITNPDSVNMYQDSAIVQVHKIDSTLSYIGVDSIMSKLVNCFGNATNKQRMHDTLVAMIQRGEVHNGVFLPEQVRYAITSAGMSLSDLCHPYLFNYDYYDDGLGERGNCKSGAFYDAVKDFFNDNGINNALKATTTTPAIFTPPWNSTNLFATLIAGALPGTATISLRTVYDATNKTYRIACFRAGAGVNDSLVLSLRSSVEATVNNNTYPLFYNPGNLNFDKVACYFEDPQAFAEGYIGRFLFRASITRTDNVAAGIQTIKANLTGWNNSKIAMNDASDNLIANCVPCTQFKTIYKAFADSMQVYTGYSADHPLFIRSLRNFTNYNLKKVFSDDQYTRFLNSCAFADSLTIPMYGGYGRINIPTTAFATFKSDLLTNDTINIKPIIDYRIGSNEYVVIDYRYVPYNKLRLFNDKLQIAGGVVRSTVLGSFGTLWLPTAASINTILVGTPFTAGAPQPVTIIRNNSQYSYNKYLVNLTGTPTYAQVSAGVYNVRQQMYNNSVNGYWLPEAYATVNEDYTLPEKQQLLNYTYSMQNLSPAKVLDTLQDYFLEGNITAFASSDVSYINPSYLDKYTDLYYTNPANVFPGYDTMMQIFGWAKSVLGGNKIFIPSNINTYTATTSLPGSSLKLYRCSDGLYWYRFFAPNLKLYNVYVRIPAYVYEDAQPTYNMVGIKTANGDSSSRRFTLALTSPTMPGDTIYASGSTDFDIAWSHKLSDVLLGNEEAHAHSPQPVSGEPGGADNCEQLRLYNAVRTGKDHYTNYIDSFRTALRSAFYAHVMSQIGEKLWIEYIDKRFAYTLYNYDLAGNLVQTVPPEGVHKLDSTSASYVDSMRLNKLYAANEVPGYYKATKYEYNTINQPVREITPDAGVKNIYYDAKGNVILSQNDKQRKKGLFTYSLYDGQNRVVETGEVSWTDACPVFAPTKLYIKQNGVWVKTSPPSPCACENLTDSLWEYCMPNTGLSYDNTAFANNIRSKPRTQVVATVYDNEYANMSTISGMSRQENLRSRVAANMYYEACPPGVPGSGYIHATHYSYDAAGNVMNIIQDMPELGSINQRYKRVDYEYDLHSGKVNMLSYNRGFSDQFYQRYNYDADNRIVKAETSHDGFIWKRDAEYTYYQHGPLARMSLGDQRVQGVDYAYTLQGWLKAINGSMIDTTLDMGGDGKSNTITPKDAFATVIDYYKGDYIPIGNTPVSTLPQQSKSLYNGNIARQTTDLAPFSALTAQYTYDQMNRIRKASYAQLQNNVLNFNSWYASAYKYDLDGNIQQLVRREGTGTLMDSMKYSYPLPTKNNQLADVLDYASFTQAGVEDIKPYTTIGNSRMLYDEVGNLVKDLTSNTDSVLWNIYGKTTEIVNNGKDMTLRFLYDGSGQRVAKKQTVTTDTASFDKNTYYVRDASGNILAEYESSRKWTPGGNIIQVISGIYNGMVPVSNNTWINGLNELGYLQDPGFAAYITGIGGEQSPMAAGAYLAGDANQLQKFMMANSDYGVMAALCRYNGQQHKYPAGAAILLDIKGYPDTWLANINYTLFSNKDANMQTRTLQHMCSSLPVVKQQIANESGINPEDSTHFYQYMLQQGPDYFVTKLNRRYQENNMELLPWYNAITADSTYLADKYSVQQGYVDQLRNTIVKYGDIAATNEAKSNNTNKSENGIYAFASWWPGSATLLSDINGGSPLPMINYYSDPVAYMTNFLQSYDVAYTDTAVSKVSGFDYKVLAAKMLPPDEEAPVYTDEPQIKYEDFHLASHHIYGSSRIGIDAYWPKQYNATWDYEHSVMDTVRLYLRQPWYSYLYNAEIQPYQISPFGNTMLGQAMAQHLLGQKQYELTNHLGNVQVTVSDKRHAKDLNGDGIRDVFLAGLPAVYDYYPFGMLMPGRTTQDTGKHCTLVMQTQVVPQQVFVNEDLSQNSTGTGGATLSYGPASVSASGSTGGVKHTLTVTPGQPVTLYLTVSMSASPVSIGVSETVGGGPVNLTSMTVNSAGQYVLNFTPTTANPWVQVTLMVSLSRPTTFLTVRDMGVYKTQYVTQDVVVQLCNGGDDKYEFGFNGKYKDNEIAGIGNNLDFGARMYDSRSGRWWSVDKLAKKYSQFSPYNFAINNPIIFIDKDGNEIYLYGIDAEKARAALSLQVSYTITLDTKTGQLSAVLPPNWTPKDAFEDKLLEGLHNKDIRVNAFTTRSDNYETTKKTIQPNPGQTRAGLVGGAYLGSDIDFTEEGAKTTATQYINVDQFQRMEASGVNGFGTTGENVGHEIIEAYIGAKIDPGGSYGTGFAKAHEQAKQLKGAGAIFMVTDPQTNDTYISTDRPVNGTLQATKTLNLGAIGNTTPIPQSGPPQTVGP
jgi:RHS repeat-associated protein